MWGLLVSTILTSAVDSLNPIALTQQFVLQGIVKKPKHIWYFIVSILLTNLVSGFLADFGGNHIRRQFFWNAHKSIRSNLICFRINHRHHFSCCCLLFIQENQN